MNGSSKCVRMEAHPVHTPKARISHYHTPDRLAHPDRVEAALDYALARLRFHDDHAGMLRLTELLADPAETA